MVKDVQNRHDTRASDWLWLLAAVVGSSKAGGVWKTPDYGSNQH